MAIEPIKFESVSASDTPAWRKPASFSFLSEIAQVPLSDSEVLQTSHHLPLAIDYLNDGPRVVAIVQPQFHRTPVIGANGQWQKGYMPIALRCLPFRLAPNADGKMDLEIAANLDSGETAGMPVRQSDGSLAAEVKHIEALLRRLEQGKHNLRRAAEILLIADVLTPLKMASMPEAASTGRRLLIVDRNKFAALSNSRVAHLVKNGFLPIDLAVASIFSQRLMPTLVAVASEGRAAGRQERGVAAGIDEFSSALALDIQVDDSELFSFERFEQMNH